MQLETFKALGLDKAWGDHHSFDYQVNGRANAEIEQALNTPGDVQYHPCPEAYEREGIAKVKFTFFAIGRKLSFIRIPNGRFLCMCPLKVGWASSP